MRRSIAGFVGLAVLVFGLTVLSNMASAVPDYRFSIDDKTVTEGATANFKVTVSPAPSTGDTVTVTADAVAGGSATSGTDYTDPGPLILSFDSSNTERTYAVPTTDDFAAEPSESFLVKLTAPAFAGGPCFATTPTGSCTATVGITKDTGVGTILDNEARVTINDVSLNEGNSGTTPFAFTMTITAAPPPACTVDVPFSTSDGTANAADYSSAGPSAKFTIVGDGVITSDSRAVNVFGDTTTEPNETFNVTLGTPAPTVGCNGTAFQGTAVGTKGTGTGTILNDDGVTPTTTPAPTTTPIPTITPTPTPTATPTPTPTPTPAPATLNISNGAPRPARPGTGCAFTITLTRAATGVVTVDFATADGTAHAGSFYSSTMGTLTFAPGETSKTVNVNVLKRARKKKNFFMNLSNPVGAPVADGNGVCTIDRRGH